MDKSFRDHTSRSTQITCPVLKVDKSYRRRCFIIDKIETLVGAEIHFGT